jgi:hypothetical protein
MDRAIEVPASSHDGEAGRSHLEAAVGEPLEGGAEDRWLQAPAVEQYDALTGPAHPDELGSTEVDPAWTFYEGWFVVHCEAAGYYPTAMMGQSS